MSKNVNGVWFVEPKIPHDLLGWGTKGIFWPIIQPCLPWQTSLPLFCCHREFLVTHWQSHFAAAFSYVTAKQHLQYVLYLNIPLKDSERILNNLESIMKNSERLWEEIQNFSKTLKTSSEVYVFFSCFFSINELSCIGGSFWQRFTSSKSDQL